MTLRSSSRLAPWGAIVTDIGEVLAMPVIEFVGHQEPGYVPLDGQF